MKGPYFGRHAARTEMPWEPARWYTAPLAAREMGSEITKPEVRGFGFAYARGVILMPLKPEVRGWGFAGAGVLGCGFA